MRSNRHSQTIVQRFQEPFTFETTYLGKTETISELEVAHEEWGNPAHPVILVCHALSQNTHTTDLDDPDDFHRSWWTSMVGPGRAVDTDKYRVICINMLGGCGGTSGPATVNPETGRPFGLHFPVVSIGDMVRSQKILMDHLGIKRLHAVIGGSMGGFQALEWGILYPDFVERIIPVASSAYSNQFMIMTNRVQIDAIQSDRVYKQGDYHDGAVPESGLAVARMVGFTTFISPLMMEKKFQKDRNSKREPHADAGFHQQMLHEAENYLRHVSEPFSKDFDPNSMVYLLQSWTHFDLAIKYGTLAKAVEPIQAKTMLICASGDNLFPPYLSYDVLRALEVNNKKAEVVTIDDDYGHDFFLIPEIILDKITPHLVRFLST